MTRMFVVEMMVKVDDEDVCGGGGVVVVEVE